MSKLSAVLSYCIFTLMVIAGIFAIEKGHPDFNLPHKLCDGFFVSSVLLFALSGFRFIIYCGFFNGISYSLKKLFNKTNGQTYFDYVQQRREKKDTSSSMTIFFALGEFLIAFVLATVPELL